MKILKIRTVKAIEFGGLKFGQEVDLGDKSIAVLNGLNEAGKSTLMELMSWVLVGPYGSASDKWRFAVKDNVHILKGGSITGVIDTPSDSIQRPFSITRNFKLRENEGQTKFIDHEIEIDQILYGETKMLRSDWLHEIGPISPNGFGVSHRVSSDRRRVEEFGSFAIQQLGSSLFGTRDLLEIANKFAKAHSVPTKRGKGVFSGSWQAFTDLNQQIRSLELTEFELTQRREALKKLDDKTLELRKISDRASVRSQYLNDINLLWEKIKAIRALELQATELGEVSLEWTKVFELIPDIDLTTRQMEKEYDSYLQAKIDAEKTSRELQLQDSAVFNRAQLDIEIEPLKSLATAITQKTELQRKLELDVFHSSESLNKKQKEVDALIQTLKLTDQESAKQFCSPVFRTLDLSREFEQRNSEQPAVDRDMDSRRNSKVNWIAPFAGVTLAVIGVATKNALLGLIATSVFAIFLLVGRLNSGKSKSPIETVRSLQKSNWLEVCSALNLAPGITDSQLGILIQHREELTRLIKELSSCEKDCRTATFLLNQFVKEQKERTTTFSEIANRLSLPENFTPTNTAEYLLRITQLLDLVEVRDATCAIWNQLHQELLTKCPSLPVSFDISDWPEFKSILDIQLRKSSAAREHVKEVNSFIQFFGEENELAMQVISFDHLSLLETLQSGLSQEKKASDSSYQDAISNSTGMKGQISELETPQNVGFLVSQRMNHLSAIRNSIVKAGTYSLLHQIIAPKVEESKAKTPKILNYAQDLLHDLTSGSWTQLELIEEKLQIEQGLGSSFHESKLSTGGANLLNLVLRLSFLNYLETEGQKDCALPIILDDPFASLDDKRRGNVMSRLVEESKVRQVIILTCNESNVELARGFGVHVVEFA